MPRKNQRTGSVITAIAIVAAVVQCAPMTLAFPYHAQIGTTAVYSEMPIVPSFRTELTRADQLASKSPFWHPSVRRQIYLTTGGWRWRLLSLQHYHAFAFRRPFNAIVINKTDIENNRVENGSRVGGQRSLSGVLAHETTHTMLAHAFGELEVLLLPAWATEGYADFVAGESSLSDEEARLVRANEPNAPALAYHEYRKRVAAALQHQTAEQFFASVRFRNAPVERARNISSP